MHELFFHNSLKVMMALLTLKISTYIKYHGELKSEIAP